MNIIPEAGGALLCCGKSSLEVLDYCDDHDRDDQGEQARQHHPEVVEQRHLGAEGKIHRVDPKFAS